MYDHGPRHPRFNFNNTSLRNTPRQKYASMKTSNSFSSSSIAWDKPSLATYSEIPFPECKNSYSFYYQLSLQLNRLLLNQTVAPIRLLVFFKLSLQLRSGKKMQKPAPTPLRLPLRSKLHSTRLEKWKIHLHCAGF